MKTLASIVLLLLTITAPSILKAQRAPVKVVKGQLVDSASGTPLAGVTIRFEATGYGAGKTEVAVTDANGNFSIKLSDRYFWDMKIDTAGYGSFVCVAVNNDLKRMPLNVRLKKSP